MRGIILKVLGFSILVGLAFSVPNLIMRLLEYKERIKDLETQNNLLITHQLRIGTSSPLTATYPVIFFRVNDSIAFLSTSKEKHQSGYADIFFNNEAEKPHWDVWDGEKYQHIYNFGCK